jgi:hypothetical protein
MTLKTRHRCVEITHNGAKFTAGDGEETFIRADTVIYSLGATPNDLNLEGIGVPIARIGHCEKPGNVRSSITTGYRAALGIL